MRLTESDTLSQIPHPMGPKATKRKMKEKRGATSSSIEDSTGMEAAIREKSEATKSMEDEKGLWLRRMRLTESISVTFFFNLSFLKMRVAIWLDIDGFSVWKEMDLVGDGSG